jgi:hypothetical protein
MKHFETEVVEGNRLVPLGRLGVVSEFFDCEKVVSCGDSASLPALSLDDPPPGLHTSARTCMNDPKKLCRTEESSRGRERTKAFHG